MSGLRSSKGAIFGTGEQGIDEKHQGDFLRAVCSLEAKEELEALVREVAGCLGFFTEGAVAEVGEDEAGGGREVKN